VPASQDDKALGGGTLSDGLISGRLAARDATLALGGRLYLRLTGIIPDQDEVKAEDVTLSSPSLLDVYLDARPNDHVRAYTQARLSHDWSIQTGDTDAFGNEAVRDKVLLDQLWLKFDVGNRLFVTAGQQRIKWGSGRFWNPTDFLNQQALDPLAEFDERTGVSLVKLHLPIESAGLNFYAVGNLEGASSLDQVGGALRAEWAVGPGEIALSAAARDGQPLRLGADLSTGLSIFDVHVEGAVKHGHTSRWTGDFDMSSFTFPTEKDTSDDWIPQVDAGLNVTIQYNDEDTVTLGGEYFYNGEGYDDASLYPWLFVNGDYTPFYLGKHYAAAFVLLAGPGNWDDTSFTASVLGNLSDQSYAARLDASTLVRTWLSINGYVQYSFGESGELHYSLSVPAVPGVDGLENGIDVVAPLLTVGLGAQVKF
jgi:hypothetical protein